MVDFDGHRHIHLDLGRGGHLDSLVELDLGRHVLRDRFGHFGRHFDLSVYLDDDWHVDFTLVLNYYWDALSIVFIVLDGLENFGRYLNHFRSLLNSRNCIFFRYFVLLEHLHVLVTDLRCALADGKGTDAVSRADTPALGDVAAAVDNGHKFLRNSLLDQLALRDHPDGLLGDVVLLHDHLISVHHLLDHSDLLTTPRLILPLRLLLLPNLGLHLRLRLLNYRLLHHDALHLPGLGPVDHSASLDDFGLEIGHRGHTFLRLENSFLDDSGERLEHRLLRHVGHISPHRLRNRTVLVLWVHVTVLVLVFFLGHAGLDDVPFYEGGRVHHHLWGDHYGHSYGGADHLLLDFVPEGLLIRIGRGSTAPATPGQLAR